MNLHALPSAVSQWLTAFTPPDITTIAGPKTYIPIKPISVTPSTSHSSLLGRVRTLTPVDLYKFLQKYKWARIALCTGVIALLLAPSVFQRQSVGFLALAIFLCGFRSYAIVQQQYAQDQANRIEDAGTTIMPTAPDRVRELEQHFTLLTNSYQALLDTVKGYSHAQNGATRMLMPASAKELKVAIAYGLFAMHKTQAHYLKITSLDSRTWRCLVIKNQHGHVDIALPYKPIGSGTFGKVYAIHLLSQTGISQYAIKRLRPNQCSTKLAFQLQSFENEYHKLHWMHMMLDKLQMEKTGLQEAPYALLQVTTDEGIQIPAIIGTLHDADGSALAIDSDFYDHPAVIIDTMLQLFKGLKSLQTLQIYHGDINPRNIYFTKLCHNAFKVCLADFGNALSLAEKLAGRKGAYTPGYQSPGQHTLLQAYQNSGALNSYATLLWQSDLYALVVSLYEIITNSGYATDSNQGCFNDSLIAHILPAKIVEMMKDGLHVSDFRRPDADRFIEALTMVAAGDANSHSNAAISKDEKKISKKTSNSLA
jgi:hypothetical protein